MKFNERLIELRRKEGLSQEELGYKLNVTRQTVSKWEMGQTTPEMDKLVAMSKIFKISVDELITESEVTSHQKPILEEQPIGNENTKNNKKIIAIIVGVLVILIVVIIGKVLITNNTLDKFFGIVDKTTKEQQNRASGIFDKATNVIDQVTKEQEQDKDSMTDEFFNVLDKVTNTINQTTKTE